MRLRHLVLSSAACAAFTLSIGAAAPVQAQDGRYYDMPPPAWDRDRRPSDILDPATREAWLAECRRRLSGRDKGLGGAAIGGVLGGVAGNRIAGRGDRTVGTIAGAAVGAAAGMAIDRAEDGRRVRDECEAYLDDYYARYHQGYGPGRGHGYQHGYGYGYPAYGSGCCYGTPMMMVPIVKTGEPECTETVEYEYIDEPIRRAPPPRAVPDKRVPVK